MRLSTSDTKKIKAFLQSITLLSRIGDDLIISASPDMISLRSLNSTKSALPHVSYYPSYFDEYRFIRLDSHASYQLNAPYLVNCIKMCSNAESLEWEIDQEEKKLTMNTLDRLNISSTHEIYLEDTVPYDAVYDISSYVGTIICRCDVFDKLGLSFNNLSNVYFQLTQPDSFVISGDWESSPGLSARLIIQNCDNCKIDADIQQPSKKVVLAFKDFMVGIGISRILNQKACIKLPEPGMPIIIQSNMSGMAVFEMALATIPEIDDEDGPTAAVTASNPTSTRIWPSTTYEDEVADTYAPTKRRTFFIEAEDF